jgi:hypothetical protein
MTINIRSADAGEFRPTPQTKTPPMADLLLEPKRDDHQHALGGRRTPPINPRRCAALSTNRHAYDDRRTQHTNSRRPTTLSTNRYARRPTNSRRPTRTNTTHQFVPNTTHPPVPNTISQRAPDRPRISVPPTVGESALRFDSALRLSTPTAPPSRACRSSSHSDGQPSRVNRRG